MGDFNTIRANKSAEQPLLKPDFPSYIVDIIDGVTFKVDLSKDARYAKDGQKISNSHRVIDFKFQDKAVDEKALFIVATNNYRASGSGSGSGGGKSPALDDSNILFAHRMKTVPYWLMTYLVLRQ